MITATIRPDERDIPPDDLARLVRDCPRMRPDPPALDPEYLAEVLRECWRPFHIETRRR